MIFYKAASMSPQVFDKTNITTANTCIHEISCKALAQKQRCNTLEHQKLICDSTTNRMQERSGFCKKETR